jgi:hypothetical protein
MTALTSQKLLRIPLDVFQQKDIPDIDKILRKLKVVMLPRYFHYIDPADDRVRRIARALLALTADRKTTNDYPLTQSLRRLRLRIARESRPARRMPHRAPEPSLER